MMMVMTLLLVMTVRPLDHTDDDGDVSPSDDPSFQDNAGEMREPEAPDCRSGQTCP